MFSVSVNEPWTPALQSVTCVAVHKVQSSLLMSFLYWWNGDWPQCSTCAERKATSTFLDLLAKILLIQPHMIFTLPYCKGGWWLISNPVSTRTPNVFLQSCFLVYNGFLGAWKSLHLCLLSFMSFLPAHFSSFSWTLCLPFIGCVNHCPSLVLSTKLLKDTPSQIPRLEINDKVRQYGSHN